MIVKKMKKKLILALAALTSFSVCFGMGYFLSRAEENTDAEGNTAAISPQTLFTAADSIILQENVSSPDFVFNGTANYVSNAITIEDSYFENPTEYGDTHKRYVPERFDSGLMATFKKTREALTFNSVIDVSELSVEKAFIEFLPVAKTKGVADISHMEITLQDIYDPNNYITIVLATGEFINATYYSVYTNEISRIGYYMGGYIPGVATSTSVTGFGKGDRNNTSLGNRTKTEGGIISPYALHFDPNTLDVIVSDPSAHYATTELPSTVYNAGKIGTILNLANEEVIGEGNTFKGFTNNRAKLSISIHTLSGAAADVLIYSVNGHALGGTEIIDTDEPDLTVAIPATGVPYAMPNKEYKIFDAVGTDSLEGQCRTNVYLQTPDSDEYVKLTGTTFTPTKEGTYTLRYEAVDGKGNMSYENISIQSSYTVDSADIFIEDLEKDSVVVGDEVKVPAYTVIGGAGASESGYKVYRVADGSEMTVEKGRFTPTIAGRYEIRYTTRDYLETVFTRSLFVEVVASQTPSVHGKLNVPSSLIDGQTVQFPTIDAYDYESIVGVNQKAELKITVKGNGQETVLGEDRLFDADKGVYGENITVEYKYYCKNYPDKGVEYEFDCKIKEMQYAADYFDYDADSFDTVYNVYGEALSKFLRFELKNSQDTSKITFINAVPASNAMVNFAVEKDNQRFAALRFTFTDRDNADVNFSVDVKKKDATSSTAIYNGESLNFTGGFNNDANKTEKTLGIGFRDGLLVNAAGGKIFTIKNEDGSTFSFPSGYCKISISFVGGAVKSGVNIISIRKQGFSASYDAEGNMNAFTDSVRPDVVFQVDANAQYKIGEKCYIPMGYAADELTSYMEVTVTVTDPNGVKLFNKEPMREGLSFMLESYGTYNVVYNTLDASGRSPDGSEFSVKVLDVTPPTITLLKENTVSAKVNEKITLPEWIISDNLDKNVKYIVSYRDLNGNYRVINLEEDFILSEAGQYMLVFYAVDAEYNTSSKEVKLVVEG